MKDLYAVLGLNKQASQDDIKRAYRRLAKKYHPDLNPGSKDAEQKFKEVSQAYDILADPEKRKRYDAGEIDASGQEQAPRGGGFYRTYTSGGGGKYRDFDFGQEFTAEDIFADLFGGGFGGFGGEDTRTRTRRTHARGGDVNYAIRVGFVEAATGTRKRVRLADGQTVDITVPPGCEDGQSLRLKGKGKPGQGGGPAGDAFVKIRVEPHPYFTRQDKDIHLDLPVALQEAVEGATVTVPTIDGPVSMRIPPGSNTDKVMRLRGRGIQPKGESTRGDQYVRLKVVLPDKIDDELRKLARKWSEKHPYDPRRKAGMA